MSSPHDDARPERPPVVSIIIPTYRAEEFLNDCLETVLAQTHSLLQVIVVDDGSPDASADIATAWSTRDERVHVVRAPHGGAASARNTGLDRATGDYITFVDADDVVHPRHVEWLLEAVCLSGADLVTAGMSQYPNGGDPEFRQPTAVTASPPEAVLERIVTSGVGFASCGKLARADLFAEVRYRTGLPFEDLGVLPNLFAAATLVAETDAVGYGYRRYDESTEGGHQRLLKTDLIRVLALNISAARETYETHPALAGRLVVGYVIHAAKSLEAQTKPTSKREADFDAAYRRLIRGAGRELRQADDLSLTYKLALVLSFVSPPTFVKLFKLANKLKETVLPQLRRR